MNGLSVLISPCKIYKIYSGIEFIFNYDFLNIF